MIAPRFRRCLFNTAHLLHKINHRSDFAPGLCDTEVNGQWLRKIRGQTQNEAEQKKKKKVEVAGEEAEH